MSRLALEVRELDRVAVQRWLPQLSEWLLPGGFYGVQHTWPQLYRSDGRGRFFAVIDGDRLRCHCAVRTVELRLGPRRLAINLLGSVATDPAERGRGLATAVIDAALQATAAAAPHTLLWAEHPSLYERAGFVAGGEEQCLLLARRPRRDQPSVRVMTLADHPDLLALHQQKPVAVVRDATAMATLLSTPGMQTFVLERDGRAAAYACTGKGADLEGHWHELGGSDEDLAELLPVAMHLADQREAVVLLPPYRPRLADLLGPAVVGRATLEGPMQRALSEPLRGHWIDGLDSV